MKNKGIIRIIGLILALLLLVYLWRETSWNFTFLGFLGIFLVFLAIKLPPLFLSQDVDKNGKLGSFYRVYGLKDRIPEQLSPVKNTAVAWWASLLIVIFTVCTFFTLSNYFYADEKVYTNNEHHALRVDGVLIKEPKGFTLVQNGRNAFFDSDGFNGSVVIEDFDEKGVTLAYNGFTHPIYKQTGSKDSLLNSFSSVISFRPNDTVTFENKSGDSLKFKFVDYGAESSKKNYFRSERDSAEYFFRRSDTADWKKSSVTTLFVRGYSFSDLLNGKDIDTEGFDFNGINIARAYSFPRAKNYERADEGGTQYILDINSLALGDEEDKISRITVGGKTIDLNDKNYFSGKIKVGYKTEKLSNNILFGYGEEATLPFSFSLDTTRNTLTMNFKMGLYRQLYCVKDKKVNSLYVTNSLIKDLKLENESEIGVNAPDNVLLFDFFDKWDNVNMFRPFNLFFTAGSTMEQMTVLCDANDEDRAYKAGEQIEGVSSEGDGGVEWHLTIENLRDSTPFGAEKMLWVVWIVALCSFIAINFHNLFGGSRNIYKYHRNAFSYAEFAAYMAIIYFVAFRCFLLWRTSVFRPLENISKYELETIFYNKEHFYYLLACIAVFYVVILVVKALLLHGFKSEKRRSIKDIINKDPIYARLVYYIEQVRGLLVGKLFFVVVPLFYVASACLTMVTDSRKGLLAIMLSYFVADILINIRSKQWTVEKNDDTTSEEIVEDAVSSFIYSLGNMLLTAGVMVIINDTGFLIMFATYCLLAFCIKLHELYVRIHKEGNHNIYIYWLFLVAFFILIVAFLNYKEIIIGAINSRLLILVPALAFALLLLFIGRSIGGLQFVHRFPFLKWNGKPIMVAWYATLVGIVVGVIMFASGTTLSDHLGKHTLQRINVQLYEPHEALAMTESKLDELRFLQASHNHFIIEQYYDKSREVTLFGEQGEGFLKMQPQSKLGAMWNAQVTDIVLLRYVITEHARILPFIFLALILSMFYYGMRETTYFWFTKSLLVQIPLLLFVQGWLVWLANTQRFVFFGQDFPLLSITAKVMIVYVFVLLLIWVLAAILEAIMCRAVWSFDNKLKQNTYKPLNDNNRLLSGWISFFGVVILASSYFFAEPVAKDKEGRYNMATLLKPEGAGKYIAKIDTLFVNYQKDIRQSGKQAMSLRRNMHSQIQAFEKVYGDSIRKLFVSEALNNQSDTTEYKFPLRIWQNYVSSGSYNNNPTGLLHVYNKKGVLRLATRTSYYDLTLPIRESDVWKNHIVENYSPTHNHDTIIKDGGKKSYVYYQLPENWVREGQTLHLLKKWQTDDLNVVSLGDNQRISLAGAEFNNSIALDAGDYVYVGEERIETLPLENRNYWARNILVNGKRQFIYPQGEAMFWMKGFAEVVKDSLNDKDGDVPVTLNRDLSVALYEILKSSSSQKSNDFNSRSVIVADGNGHIRAMVDYKRNYELDPNDGERIDSLTEALYMNQKGNNRAEESDYLENRNLAHMRGGPGSSQKPLVWNAVASAVDFNWKDLILYRIYPDMLLKDNKGVRGLMQYNGGRMKTNKYQPADELDGNKDITLTSFLARSSNYYSALMVYLGLHNMSTYKDRNVFIPLLKDDKTQGAIFKYYTAPNLLSDSVYQANYPFIKIGTNGRTMTLNKKISYLDYNKSVLHHQFTDVMGLYDNNVSQELSRLAYNLYPKYLGGNINGFLTPATSSLNLALFKEVETRGPNNENNGMRNISLGGAEFWTVTPLKMAEMYGKVVSLNKEFTLSLDPNYKNVIEEWIPSGKNYYDARPVMFKGMNLFFTDVDGYKGNGNGIVLKNDVSGESVGSKTMNGKTYYFYGKTGTAHNDGYKRTKQNTLVTENDLNVLYRQGRINEIKEFLDEEDFTITIEGVVKIKKVDEFRRLAIIITDRDLQTVDMNDLENVKFYTLFFTYDYKTSDLRETSRKIINEVLYSKVFNDYMNN